MKTFLTITSPVFSELVVILRRDEIENLSADITFFHTWRRMNEIKRFKLVFLLEILGWPEGEREILEEALRSATAEGLLDFLDSPPTIRVESVILYEWIPLAALPKLH